MVINSSLVLRVLAFVVAVYSLPHPSSLKAYWRAQTFNAGCWRRARCANLGWWKRAQSTNGGWWERKGEKEESLRDHVSLFFPSSHHSLRPHFPHWLTQISVAPPPRPKKSDRERQGMREKCMESVSLKSDVLNIFCSAPKTELQTKISGINKCDILELLDGWSWVWLE